MSCIFTEVVRSFTLMQISYHHGVTKMHDSNDKLAKKRTMLVRPQGSIPDKASFIPNDDDDASESKRRDVQGAPSEVCQLRDIHLILALCATLIIAHSKLLNHCFISIAASPIRSSMPSATKRSCAAFGLHSSVTWTPVFKASRVFARAFPWSARTSLPPTVMRSLLTALSSLLSQAP